MSGKVAIQKTTLEAIGNAVRGKEGSTDLIPVNTLAERITALPAPTISKLPQIIDRTVTEITAEDLEGVTSIGKYAFYPCESLTSVTIPNSVTSIGEHAFNSCDSLNSVTIGNGVTSIGYGAFNGCYGLKSVYYDGDIASWCNISFGNDDANPVKYANKLYIKNSETNEYELLTNLVIPDSVTEIKSYAFYKCYSLTSVTIGNGVTSIGNYAFRECVSFVSIIIPDSVTSIGNNAFRKCTGLTSVRIGSGVTNMNNYTFADCSALTDIYIDAEEDSISGAPWGATNATVHWNTPLPTEEA